MTGKFSIKRRKQNAPNRVYQALGIGVGRSSPHVASKRGHAHITDASPAARFERAQAWHARTGRPLPPQMRPRQRLAEPAAKSLRDRFADYLAAYPPLGKRTTEAILDDDRLTSTQRRRLLHKAGAHGERPAGFTPQAAVTPGRPGPHSPAQRRRAATDAAQRARHASRLLHEQVTARAAEIYEAGQRARVSRGEFVAASQAEHARYLDEIAQPWASPDADVAGDVRAAGARDEIGGPDGPAA